MSDPHSARHSDKEDKRTLLQRVLQFINPGPNSTEELVAAMAEAEDDDVINADTRVLLERVLRMAEMTAGDVMVPTRRMDLLDIESPIDEQILQVIRTAHSRFPVFQGERDNIIGVLLAKDLLKLSRSPSLNIRTMVRPANRALTSTVCACICWVSTIASETHKEFGETQRRTAGSCKTPAVANIGLKRNRCAPPPPRARTVGVKTPACD